MFALRFGAHLDGADCLRMPDHIGHVDVGPSGFLHLLEIHLGLGGILPSAAARAVEYRAALQASLLRDRFYAASFAEIGRAHVCPVTNAHLVCRLLLEKKKI